MNAQRQCFSSFKSQTQIPIPFRNRINSSQKKTFAIDKNSKEKNAKNFKWQQMDFAIFCITLLQVQKIKAIQCLKQSLSVKQTLFGQKQIKKFDISVTYWFLKDYLNVSNQVQKHQNQILIYYILSTLVDQNIVSISLNNQNKQELKSEECKLIKEISKQLMIQFYRQKKCIQKYFQSRNIRLKSSNNQQLRRQIEYQIKNIFKQINLKNAKKQNLFKNNLISSSKTQINFYKLIKFINANLKSTPLSSQNQQSKPSTFNQQNATHLFNSTQFSNIKNKLLNIKKDQKKKDSDQEGIRFKIYVENLLQIVFRLIHNPKILMKNSPSLSYRHIYDAIQNNQKIEKKYSKKSLILQENKMIQKKLTQYIEIKKQANQYFNNKVPIQGDLKSNKISQDKSKSTSIQTTARYLNPPLGSNVNTKAQSKQFSQTPIKNLNFNVVQQSKLCDISNIQNQKLHKSYYNQKASRKRESPSFNFQFNQGHLGSQKKSKADNAQSKIFNQSKTKKLSKYEIVEELFKIRQLRRSIHDHVFIF